MSTDATPVSDPLPPLPDDPAVLQTMLRELLVELRKSNRRVEQLEHRLTQLLRQVYGRRSEKLNPDQLLLFADLNETPPPAEPPPCSSASPPPAGSSTSTPLPTCVTCSPDSLITPPTDSTSCYPTAGRLPPLPPPDRPVPSPVQDGFTERLPISHNEGGGIVASSSTARKGRNGEGEQ